MAKSLSKIWLRGFKRLLAIQTEHAQKTAKRAQARPVRAATTKPSSKAHPLKPAAALRTPVKREAPRESRVRPRAAAWASGAWTRSFHSAPAAPGRLVNHLQYGLYIPSGHAHGDSPIGCPDSSKSGLTYGREALFCAAFAQPACVLAGAVASVAADIWQQRVPW